MRSSEPAPTCDPGKSEAPVAMNTSSVDGGAVQVGVRADHHGVAETERVLRTAPQQRVLHHHHVGADGDRAEIAAHDRTRQHA